ncbi:UNVERIFIED_CONTAM: hypothetical protein NCL1_33558 [Trichonephila clavipes]
MQTIFCFVRSFENTRDMFDYKARVTNMETILSLNKNHYQLKRTHSTAALVPGQHNNHLRNVPSQYLHQ